VDPLAGIDHKVRTNGPGKLTRAMNITRKHNGVDMTRGPLTVRKPREERPIEITVTPRIGITKCADWPLRFLIGVDPR
jgi:DNA-3-methyladenine glycosylase